MHLDADSPPTGRLQRLTLAVCNARTTMTVLCIHCWEYAIWNWWIKMMKNQAEGALANYFVAQKIDSGFSCEVEKCAAEALAIVRVWKVNSVPPALHCGWAEGELYPPTSATASFLPCQRPHSFINQEQVGSNGAACFYRTKSSPSLFSSFTALRKDNWIPKVQQSLYSPFTPANISSLAFILWWVEYYN